VDGANIFTGAARWLGLHGWFQKMADCGHLEFCKIINFLLDICTKFGRKTATRQNNNRTRSEFMWHHQTNIKNKSASISGIVRTKFDTVLKHQTCGGMCPVHLPWKSKMVVATILNFWTCKYLDRMNIVAPVWWKMHHGHTEMTTWTKRNWNLQSSNSVGNKSASISGTIRDKCKKLQFYNSV